MSPTQRLILINLALAVTAGILGILLAAQMGSLPAGLSIGPLGGPSFPGALPPNLWLSGPSPDLKHPAVVITLASDPASTTERKTTEVVSIKFESAAAPTTFMSDGAWKVDIYFNSGPPVTLGVNDPTIVEKQQSSGGQPFVIAHRPAVWRIVLPMDGSLVRLPNLGVSGVPIKIEIRNDNDQIIWSQGWSTILSTDVVVANITPAPGATPACVMKACPQLESRVPRSVIDNRLNNASGADCATRRTWLTLQNIGVPFDPLNNSLVFKSGCP